MKNVKIGSLNNKNLATPVFIVGVIIAIGIMLSIVSPNFLTAYNIGIIVKQMSFFGMAALGQTLMLITIGTDLSVGSIACLSGILFAIFVATLKLDPIISIVLVLAVCAIIGAASGFIVKKLKLSPFIVTLAVSEICTGVVLVLTKGETVTGIEGPVLTLGKGMVGPIPVPTIIFIVVAIIMAYIMKNTPFGREIYAIGGNPSAARLVGINVDKKTVIIFALSALLAACGGIMTACRYSSGQPSIGESWRMNSITAAVVGGTSMTGGQGNVLGTVSGAMLIMLLSNAIITLNISQYWEKVVTGSVVLIAVAIDAVRARKRNRA
ncbi:MAG: ABC transporter permease [Acetivibrionales bacterium]|jgi:ribose transport system permease protein